MQAYWYAIVAMLFWGIGPVFGKIGLAELEPIPAMVIRAWVITALLTGFALAGGHGRELLSFNPRAALFVIMEGMCAAFLGQLAFYYALKYGEVSQVSPIASAFPVVAMVIAVIFLGEQLTAAKVVAAGLIVSGIILLKY